MTTLLGVTRQVGGRRYAVIGATGVLRPLAAALAEQAALAEAGQVFAISRRGDGTPDGCLERRLDAREPDTMRSALEDCGHLDALIAYGPAVSPESWQVTLPVERRLVVLTSQWAAPGADLSPWDPDRCVILQLGWTDDPSRPWFTPEEISQAASSSLTADSGSITVLGRVRPWVDRP